MKNLPVLLALGTLAFASANASLITFIQGVDTPAGEKADTPAPGTGAFNTTWKGFGACRDRALAGFAKTKSADMSAVVFLGDSITEQWNLRKAFPSLKTANRGISGDTSRGMLCRMKDNVLDLNPKGVVLLCGINDLNQPGGDAASIAANVRSILMGICATDATMPIFVSEVMPSASRPVETIRETNAAVDKVVAQFPGVYRIRTFNSFADDKGRPIAKFFKDGTHPNAEGYAVYQKLLEPVMTKAGLTR